MASILSLVSHPLIDLGHQVLILLSVCIWSGFLMTLLHCRAHMRLWSDFRRVVVFWGLKWCQYGQWGNFGLRWCLNSASFHACMVVARWTCERVDSKTDVGYGFLLVGYVSMCVGLARPCYVGRV